MKASFRTIQLTWFGGATSELMTQFVSARYAPGAPHAWQPAINAFQCGRCLRICVDLAGVEKSQIEVQAEPRRLLIRGMRDAPEPLEAEARAERVLALEIDYGPFEREIVLPDRVDVERITAEQRNGLLWIELPFERPS